ncbi:MAG: hypothetical protein Q4A01_08155 [Coriobacteriales bacterium]|nr:hypothetical protein [Coriobacteriales bacterium]
MKQTSICFAAALTAVLAMGTMAGCGNQSTSPANVSAESSAESSQTTTDAASSDAKQSQDEIIAELKEAAANPIPCKSVTVNETTTSVLKGDEAATADDEIASKTVYKFDANGDKLRTSMVSTIDNITLTYYSDGDDAVLVTDGPVYSGTTEQFDLPHFKGVESYLTDTFGDLRSIIDCVDTVTKEQQGDTTVYTLTVIPEKYIASDEILTMMAEYGDPLQSATFTFGFNKDGRIVSAEDKTEYTTVVSGRAVTLSDFDSTVVDPMPKADRTYEQMEQDEQLKLDALAKQIEGAEEPNGAEGSSDASEAK